MNVCIEKFEFVLCSQILTHVEVILVYMVTVLIQTMEHRTSALAILVTVDVIAKMVKRKPQASSLV